MGIVNIYREQIWSEASNKEVSQSATLSFAPSATYAYIALAGTLATGLDSEADTAITSYTVRQPDGTDVTTNLPLPQPCVLSLPQQVSSVTFVAVSFQNSFLALAHAESWE